MYMLFIWSRTYGFGWKSNPQRGAFEGVGPEMGTSVESAIWVQKSRDFRAHPFKPPKINNRYIGNFMDKRQERDKRFQGPFRDGL